VPFLFHHHQLLHPLQLPQKQPNSSQFTPSHQINPKTHSSKTTVPHLQSEKRIKEKGNSEEKRGVVSSQPSTIPSLDPSNAAVQETHVSSFATLPLQFKNPEVGAS
jgi:hypothetical protein